MIQVVAIQFWLLMLLTLAGLSIYQAVSVMRRSSGWSKSAEASSRHTTIFVRLFGVSLLFLTTTEETLSRFMSEWGWESALNYESIVQPFDSTFEFLRPFGLFLCLIPVNAFRLEFTGLRKFQPFMKWIKGLAAIILLVFASLNQASLIMLTNAAANGIVIAMGGAHMYWDGGPYLIHDVRNRMMTYEWNDQYQLLPFAAITSAIVLISLMFLFGMARRNRGELRLRQLIDVTIVATILYGFVAISILFVWTRTNPFILEATSWQSLSYWVDLTTRALLGGAVVAWICSYRPIEALTPAPAPDPFESLQQPRMMLFAFVGCWLLIYSGTWTFDAGSLAMFLIVCQQLLARFRDGGSLEQILKVDGRIFVRNWVLFALLLPPIALLVPLLPTLLLSMSN